MLLQAFKDSAVVFVQVVTQVPLRLAVGLPGETKENGRALGVFRVGTQGQTKHDAEHIFRRIRRAGRFHFIQLGTERRTERRQKAFEYRLYQRFLGTEMIVHRRQVDPGLAGDGTQTGFRKALLGKQYLCGIQNPVNRARLCHAPRPVFKTYVSNIRLGV